MIRVILADDEPLIIKGLRKLISWEAMGVEIVAEAYDGRELLELIAKETPDIVISDISMPHFTGIDVLKKIKQMNALTKVIFISAYQEFSYAKDAIAYGALDYLVKPVEKQQLQNVLLHAISLIREENEEERIKHKLNYLEKRNVSEQTQEWLDRLIDQSLPQGSEGYQTLSEILKGPYYTICAFELDRIESQSWSGREKKLIDFAIHNILQELVVQANKGHILPKNNKIILVIEHADAQEIIDLANEIKQKMNTFLKLEVSIGIGHPVKEIALLSNTYDEAMYAVNTKYFLGLNRVIPYQAYEQMPDLEKEIYSLQLNILQGITGAAWKEADLALEKALITIKAASYGNKELAVSTCFSSILFIIQEMKRSGINLTDKVPDINDLRIRLDEYKTFDDMEQGIHLIMEDLYHLIEDKAGNKEKVLMVRIKQYIDENYAKEITLESVAAIAFMNSYYFSSFFKKHANQNFKQYVTEIRMKHAVRLLVQTDSMVYEIAEQVGYNNARHFSDMFKKMFGMLPNEFKASKKMSE